MAAAATQALPDGMLVVGCGASAGGLEAMTQLLRSLPADLPAAFVLIQHLSPEHESLLSSLLQQHTKMPVMDAQDGGRLEPGHVYVGPPGVIIDFEQGRLRLSEKGTALPSYPIDHFFRSLADQAGEAAIAVVLSGTGADGAAGVRDVRGVGGITMAQSAASAKFDGMPVAAVATGAVDVVDTPAALAAEIARIAREPIPTIVPRTGHASHPAMDARDVRDEHLQRIFGLLRGATGVDFRHYKLPTIERRLQRRLVLHRLSRLEDYLRLLRERPDEVMALYRDILIHVTRFFREPESFDALVHHVLPRIIGEHQGDATLRAWVAGCSTGEEAYSLAILMLEALGDRADQIPIQIFATDVSEDAIQQARAGSYPATIATDVSPERLNRFFVKSDGGYRIVKSVRDKCVFSRQDVTRDPPFSRLDLILCRNVLIYLSAALQRRLMTVFHYALKPGRFLVLGHAETIGQRGELFAVADRRHRIYVKKSSGAAAASFAEEPQIQPAAPARLEVVPRQDVRSVQLEASRLLLDRFAPAGVVVDDDMQIVHFRGQTGSYLAPSSGEPTLHLFKMARDGLLHHLRLACIEARKTGQSARQDGVRVRQNGGWQKVHVEVMPLHVVGKPHFLVLFHPADSPTAGAAIQEGHDSPEGRDVAKAREPHESPVAPDQRLQTLEDELAATRTYLQSIIQEVEAANEELQSANEEILSSNEELQSTNEELDTAKEELQSTNEELNTVNDELHGRNEELSRANSDLMNILSSVQIAILIVAGDLRIRRFTPMAERMLNLIPSDVGRPIDHIKPNIDCPDLEHLIREAMDTVSVIERQVQDRQGGWFSLRIRPYKNVDNRIDGAVLALFDIDALRRQETELRETRHYAEAIVQSIRQPLVVLDLDLRVRTVNPGFLSTFGLDQREVLGCALHALPGGGWDGPMHRSLERLSNGERRVDRFHLDHEFSRVGRRRLDVDARRIEGPEGRPPLIVLTFDAASEQGDGGT